MAGDLRSQLRRPGPCDRKVLDVKRALKFGYGWMEGNPVTVMLVSLGLGAFATAGVIGVALRGEDTRSIITRSACALNPDGQECQRIKRESDEHQSVADACVPFRKVDSNERLLRLTKCRVHRAQVARGPKGASPDQRDVGREIGSVIHPVVPKSPFAPPSVGPAHHKPRHHPSAPSGGHKPSPVPPVPTPAPTPITAPAASQPPAEVPSSEAKPPTSKPPAALPAVEGVATGASEVAEAVKGGVERVVDGAGKSVCQVVGNCPAP
jgi:hypothetical protein